jgi:hypothetical protein
LNAKLCAGPEGGGTAGGCARYILGYSLGAREKDDRATTDERREAYHRLLQQSLERGDYGVGTVWRPDVGDGARPSAVYAKNVVSFATADQEMDALAAVARSHRVTEPVLHFVFSVNPEESKTVSDETLIRAAERTLARIDLGQNAQVYSVHRDTDHAHVHVAVASVNAETLRSWERSRNYHRLSWALRETEIERGLAHDRGLAVVRTDSHGQERVAWASRDELLAWARERAEERLSDQAQKYAMDYLAFESPQSWARDIVAPRLRECIEQAQSRDERPQWADLHLVAAQHATRLDRDTETGAIMVRLMEPSQGEGGHSAGLTRDEFGEPVPARQAHQREAVTAPIAIQLEDLIGAPPAESERPEVQSQYGVRKEFVEHYLDVTGAEHEFIERIRLDPALVSREIVNGGEAVFSRADIDRYLGARATDADTLCELSQYVEQHDSTLRMLSADTEHPIYTTAAQQTLEQRVAAKATALTRERDPGWNRPALDRAITDVEQERGITISPEQRRVLDGLEFRLSWVGGEAGTGKTTIMACARKYAEITGRPIVGFTTAQAAAEQLERASGAISMNSTRALVYEEKVGRQIVRQDAITVLDETSMLDMKFANRILDLARERNGVVIGIGDAAQLPAISAGDTHRVIADVAQKGGHYAELHEVRRQKDQLIWMRPIVADLGRSIREGDVGGVERNIRTMAEHGVFDFHADRAATLSSAALAYVDARNRGDQIVVNCASRLDARHLNKQIRARMELAEGVAFKTTQGVVEVSVGDRIVMLKNNRSLKVLNGYAATVESVQRNGGKWTIKARLDDGRIVSWNPERYRDWSHGYAVTTHKAQGQSVSTDLYVMTHHLTDVRLAHVGWTRGESALRVLVSREAYASVGELARGVAEHTAAKTDAILYRELEKKYGGPGTHWAINVRRALADAKDPLRLEYQRDQRVLNERRSSALAAVNERYQKAMANTPDGEKRSIEREHRTASKCIIEAHKPRTFVAWAGERRRAEEIQQRGEQHERVVENRHRRDLERTQKSANATRDQELKKQVERMVERAEQKKERNERHYER